VLSLLKPSRPQGPGLARRFQQAEVKIAIPRGSTAAKAIATYTRRPPSSSFGQRRHDRRARRQPGGRHVAAVTRWVNYTAKNSGGKYRNAAALGPPEDDAIGFPQGDFVWWLWLNRFVARSMRTAPTTPFGSSGSVMRQCRPLSSRRRKAVELRRRIAPPLVHTGGFGNFLAAGAKAKSSARPTDRATARWVSPILIWRCAGALFAGAGLGRLAHAGGQRPCHHHELPGSASLVP